MIVILTWHDAIDQYFIFQNLPPKHAAVLVMDVLIKDCLDENSFLQHVKTQTSEWLETIAFEFQ